MASNRECGTTICYKYAANISLGNDMDRETVLRLAQLSRIQLNEEDRQRAESQLTRLLAYFDQLAEVDTEGIEASPYPLPLKAGERRDQPGPCLTPEQVLANAPAERAQQFVVPKVIEG